MSLDERDQTLNAIRKRYGQVDLDTLRNVLCPALLNLNSLDTTVFKEHKHWRASFIVAIDATNRLILQPGRTGKFVPREYVDGTAPWSEIAKGRILHVDTKANIAHGEVYLGTSSKMALEAAINRLKPQDCLEIDQFGTAAKILSGLSEYVFAKRAAAEGYTVRRLPEDMARHVGTYANYDFNLEKAGVIKKVEIKSIWGTDTRRARLIHSKTGSSKKGKDALDEIDPSEAIGGDYDTSSCKFATQDIFAVNLFLQTGNIHDFAFARSVPKSSERPYGLPAAARHLDYVSQNPLCEVGNGMWFGTIADVWDLP